MIKLKGKAKLLVPLGIVIAALAAGFILDKLHKTGFKVERMEPGGINDHAVVMAEAPEKTAGLININTATAEELTELKGIGEGIAENIVSYREAAGDFESVDELLNVSGIGKSKLEDIRDMVCVE